MSNRFRTGSLILLCLIALVAVSCAMNRPSTAGPRNVPVFVDFVGQKVKTDPPTVTVNPGDKIFWSSSEPELTIEFRDLPNPACESGHGRCWMTVPAGKKGDHKYDAVVNVSGKPYREDPVIIIQY